MSRWKQVKHVKKNRNYGKRPRHNKKSVMERKRLRKLYYRKLARLVLEHKISSDGIKELDKNSEYKKIFKREYSKSQT